jgi:pimeloyl-ACP methyl ester carboxylesterase
LKATKDIDAFLKSKEGKRLLKDWPKEDAKFFADETWLTLMYGSMAEAFRQGDDGVKAAFQEHQLFMRTWDEPTSQIPHGRVNIWHGTDDRTCRVDNAYKIANDIPGSHLEIFEGQGHCVMFNNLEKLGEILRS